jgi:hypothetical protein
MNFKGGLRAGLHKVFESGDVKPVVFGNGTLGEIESEWFGDDAAAVNQALRSAGRIPVRISRDRTVNTPILLGDDQTLSISDAATLMAPVNFPGGRSMIENIDPSKGDANICDGWNIDSLGWEDDSALRRNKVH